MFNLSKLWKTKIENSLFEELKTDFHSHLIPGIDDGAKSIDDSLNLIKGLLKLGFKKIITTPHIYSDIYFNTSEVILNGLEIVKTAIKKEGLDVEFHAAAEYYIDQHFEELLQKGDLLPVFGKHVLVEISFYQAPPNLEDVIFNMRTRGYIPILAHPERYVYFGLDLSKYERLKDLGCKLQVNLLSLTGRYGQDVQKIAMKLINKGMVEYLATDLHNKDQLEELKTLAYSNTMSKLMKKHQFANYNL